MQVKNFKMTINEKEVSIVNATLTLGGGKMKEKYFKLNYDFHCNFGEAGTIFINSDYVLNKFKDRIGGKKIKRFLRTKIFTEITYDQAMEYSCYANIFTKEYTKKCNKLGYEVKPFQSNGYYKELEKLVEKEMKTTEVRYYQVMKPMHIIFEENTKKVSTDKQFNSVKNNLNDAVIDYLLNEKSIREISYVTAINLSDIDFNHSEWEFINNNQVKVLPFHEKDYYDNLKKNIAFDLECHEKGKTGGFIINFPMGCGNTKDDLEVIKNVFGVELNHNGNKTYYDTIGDMLKQYYKIEKLIKLNITDFDLSIYDLNTLKKCIENCKHVINLSMYIRSCEIVTNKKFFDVLIEMQELKMKNIEDYIREKYNASIWTEEMKSKYGTVEIKFDENEPIHKFLASWTIELKADLESCESKYDFSKHGFTEKDMNTLYEKFPNENFKNRDNKFYMSIHSYLLSLGKKSFNFYGFGFNWEMLSILRDNFNINFSFIEKKKYYKRCTNLLKSQSIISNIVKKINVIDCNSKEEFDLVESYLNVVIKEVDKICDNLDDNMAFCEYKKLRIAYEEMLNDIIKEGYKLTLNEKCDVYHELCREAKQEYDNKICDDICEPFTMTREEVKNKYNIEIKDLVIYPSELEKIIKIIKNNCECEIKNHEKRIEEDSEKFLDDFISQANIKNTNEGYILFGWFGEEM